MSAFILSAEVEELYNATVTSSMNRPRIDD
jgi:hypothetical protein